MSINMEKVNCPTCGADTGRKLIYQKDDGVGFYKCLGCDIEFASPRLVEEELLNLYEGDNWKDLSKYDSWSYEKWKNKKELNYYLVQENINLVERFLPNGSSVLDVGCDMGLTVKGLEEKGYYSEGVEVSSIGAKIAKEKQVSRYTT